MVLDRDLRFVGVNAAYEKAVLRTREEMIGQLMFELFPNDGDSGRRLRESFDRVFATGEAETLAFIHYEIPRPDDQGGGMEDRYWTAVHVPILGDDGEVEFLLQNTVDVTELQRLQRAASLPIGIAPGVGTPAGGLELLQRAQEAERAHRTLLDQSDNFRRLFAQAPGFMAVLTGPDHIFTFANDAYEALVGGRQVIGRTVADALPEVVGQGFVDMLDAVYRTGVAASATGQRVLLSQLGDATPIERFLDFTYQPIYSPDGAVSGVFVQGADRTESVRAAERQKTLVDELNHRVKNSLATVQSIAAQTFRATPDPVAFRDAFEARLMALSNVQNLLTDSSWVGADLGEVLLAELKPHGDSRVSVSGPAVRLTAPEALSLAMVGHELATNAAKCGALSTGDGKVSVTWSLVDGDKSGERRLLLTWTERGGPKVTPPTREGFGSRLIARTAVHDLGGTSEARFEPDGLVQTLDVVLTAA
ncbi:MAG: PAS domain-containing protein [Caulobacter sp.]|nr:PAS domain-containing protein [Caulobacter sp.]